MGLKDNIKSALKNNDIFGIINYISNKSINTNNVYNVLQYIIKKKNEPLVIYLIDNINILGRSDINHIMALCVESNMNIALFKAYEKYGFGNSNFANFLIGHATKYNNNSATSLIVKILNTNLYTPLDDELSDDGNNNLPENQLYTKKILTGS